MNAKYDLLVFKGLKTDGQNVVTRLVVGAFRMLCGAIIGLVGGLGFLLHAATQFASADFSFSYTSGGFSLNRFVIGPFADVTLGLVALTTGVWLLWCAWKIGQNPATLKTHS